MPDTDAPTLPPWYGLAARALHLAQSGDYDRAGAIVTRIAAEHGAAVIPNVLLAWTDSLIAYMPERPDGHDVRLAFVKESSGEILDDVPQATRWAGEFIAAREAMDEDTTAALLALPQSDREWSGCVSQVLMLCARNLTDLIDQGATARAL